MGKSLIILEYNICEFYRVTMSINLFDEKLLEKSMMIKGEKFKLETKIQCMKLKYGGGALLENIELFEDLFMPEDYNVIKSTLREWEELSQLKLKIKVPEILLNNSRILSRTGLKFIISDQNLYYYKYK